MKRMSAQQVERLLKREKGPYIHHYITESTIHNQEGDDIGRLSNRVLKNMLLKGKVKQIATSPEFWSDGYFILTHPTSDIN